MNKEEIRERISEVIRLFNLGKSTTEIAALCKVSEKTIQRDLKSVGILGTKICRQKIVGDNSGETGENNIRIFPIHKGIKILSTENLDPSSKKYKSVILSTELKNVQDKNHEEKNSRKGEHMTEKEITEIEVYFSFAIKLIIISAIICFITYSNYQFGLMDESLKEYPWWLLLFTFGLLELSAAVLSGLKLETRSNKLGRGLLIICISAFSIFGSNRSIATKVDNAQAKLELINESIAMHKKTIELETKLIKSTKKTWIRNKALERLQMAQKKLDILAVEKKEIGVSSTLRTNKNGLLVFKGLLVCVMLFLASHIGQDFYEIKRVILAGSH